MATVTYKKQPVINIIGGRIPLAGSNHPYTVSELLWPKDVHRWITRRLIGKTLHICCGKSKLGDCRLDLHEQGIDVRADANRLPFQSMSWDTILIDPPYNGVFQWNHDMLSEIGRVARQRIIFQHWFIPVDRRSRFKKNNAFMLSELVAWQGKSYFGRAQIITIMDRVQMSFD